MMVGQPKPFYSQARQARALANPVPSRQKETAGEASLLPRFITKKITTLA
jgi:hypothetical protein